MATTLRNLAIFFLTAIAFVKTNAQDTSTTNFLFQIKEYDLSSILLSDSILAEDNKDGKEKVKRSEILGFIGEEYQRFFIHFISVIQNPTNPYEYLVFGKTKVKETIRDFQGTITIQQARIYKESELEGYQQGFAICDVVFYEDKKQSSTGLNQGTLTSNFIIDNKGKFRYDALMFVADGFSNNEFVGNWTSYKTNNSKKCNWGDYRIPECGDLDIGAAEFSVDDKYLKNGWENYRQAFTSSPESSDAIKARQKEDEQWWK